MDEADYMLTTSDNPWSPFTQFREWYTWDITNGWHLNPDGSVGLGYCTASYLARIAKTSEENSPAQYNRAIFDAINEIVDEFNLTGNYVKVTKADYDNWIPKPAPV
jgi:hypothetical protein